MKIQNLAVIFIIIILPISIVIYSYTTNRIQVVSMQSKYDSKLNDATHDAIKAYQLNSFKSDTSYYANSKIRDIEASVNTFFNSLSTNFSTLGYTKETLQNYVPAIVYTMYDGYYIYTPYKNTWYTDTVSRSEIKDEIDEQIKQEEQKTYENNTKIYGIKPYVYYSCRYRNGNDNDVTITYSLDNYVQIQGKVDGEVVSKYGYLYSIGDASKGLYVSGDTVKYNGITISEENCTIKENIYVDGNLEKNLPCIKENGTKYYLKDDGTVFSVLNGKSQNQLNFDKSKFTNNKNAKNYYKEAYDLREFIKNSDFLSELKTSYIVDIETGNKYEEGKSPYYRINDKIFDFDYVEGIESETSNFNTHRIDVIKNAIERNLSIAISNFNNYSNVITDFQMPKLKDEDWDKIMNNIAVISFFQGANLGGKLYNGYSVITNTMNEDVVMEDSIYIKKGSNIYDITENGLKYEGATVGVFNINTEPRTATDGTTYFLPVTGNLSYDSIITKNNINKNFTGNLNKYIKENVFDDLKCVYYTALARERYGLYRPELAISGEQGNKTVTVALNPNGGNCGQTQKNVSVNNIYKTLPVPTKDGYIFNGWTTDENGTNFVTDSTICTEQNDHTLYAQWTKEVKQITVAFEGNSATNGKMQEITINTDEEITLPTNTYVKTGYTFAGWSNQKDGSVEYNNNATYSVPGNIHIEDNKVYLYAQWQRQMHYLNVNTIKNGIASPDGYEGLTFNVDVTDPLDSSNNIKYDATNVTDYYIQIPYKCTYKITANYSAGYTKKEASNSIGTMDVEDILVSPEWAGNNYTIVFNKNSSDATGTMNNQTITYGQYDVLNENTYKRNGYILTGWATSQDGNKVYDNMGIVSNLTTVPEGKVDLYAVWLKAMDISVLDIDSVSHTCIWATKYDGEKHWEYCTICNTTKNQEIHTFTKTSNAPSSAECAPVNQYYYTCKCGYNYSYRPPCQSGTKWYPTDARRHLHFKTCTKCGTWTTSQRCYDSNGKILNCGNPGTCAVCGTKVNSTYHYISNNGVCADCGVRFFTTGQVKISYTEDYSQCIYEYPVTVQNGFEFTSIPGRSYNTNFNEASCQKSQTKDGNTYYFKYVFTFNNTLQRPMYPYFGDGIYGTVNGNSVYVCNITPVGNTNIYQDHQAPGITSIVQTNQSSQGKWTTSKEFNVSGTENLSSWVTVKLINSAKKIVYTGTAVVNDGRWNINFKPEIEQFGSANWSIQVVDQLGNTCSKTFTISNIDSKSPVLLSNPDATGVWYKYRNVNISATDEGSGEVKIGLNKLSDMKLANNNNGVYTRSYNITGESYTSKKYAILMEDAAGNKTSKYIELGLFDNKMPTITKVDVNGKNVAITANDTGSGVKKYGYMNMNRGKNITWLDNYAFTLPEDGKFLIVVQDAAGNISTPYKRIIK